MSEPIMTRRGVYKDLSQSPYEYVTPYGDSFKFSSKKRLAMYERDIERKIASITTLIDRHTMRDFLPEEIIILIYKAGYSAFYRKIEG